MVMNILVVHRALCFLARSFIDQQSLEGLLRREATEIDVAPVAVMDPQTAR